MPRRSPGIERYLLERERVIVEVRQHWGVIVGPIALTVAALFFVLYLDARVRPTGGPLQVLWLLWFGLLGWLVYQIVEWRYDRFIATDKRLLLSTGLLTRKMAMMPFVKVTDMSYRRTVPGRIFGYGQFVLESAGQDQALRQIDWVPNPDHTYRVICAEIFGVPDRARRRDEGTELDPRDRPGRGDPADPFADGGDGPEGGGRVASPLRDPDPSSAPSAVDERWDWSQAIPLHRHGDSGPIPSGEVIYNSDEARLRRRMADTGPIPPPPNPAAED